MTAVNNMTTGPPTTDPLLPIPTVTTNQDNNQTQLQQAPILVQTVQQWTPNNQTPNNGQNPDEVIFAPGQNGQAHRRLRNNTMIGPRRRPSQEELNRVFTAQIQSQQAPSDRDRSAASDRDREAEPMADDESVNLPARLSFTSLLEDEMMMTDNNSDSLSTYSNYRTGYSSASSSDTRILSVARSFSFNKIGIANDIKNSESIASIVVEKVGNKRLAEWQATSHDWAQFNYFRHRRLFTDTSILCKGEIFPCHKAVMSASCEYFRALYEFYSKNNLNDEKVDLPHNNPNIIKEIINYIYTKQSNINHENVEELLETSDEYGVEGLCSQCVDYLGDHLVIENCISMRALAITYQRKFLLYLVDNFIRNNFELIAKNSMEFQDLRNFGR